MSPTIDPSARDRRVALARWVRELPHELPMLPFMLRDYARAGIRRAMHTFELALADEPEARLPLMTMPTLVTCAASSTPSCPSSGPAGTRRKGE